MTSPLYAALTDLADARAERNDLLCRAAAFGVADLAALVDERLLTLIKTEQADAAGAYLLLQFNKRVADRAAWGEAR